MKKIILASSSPRRRTLLSQLFTQFDVLSSPIDETPLHNETGYDLVKRLSLRKATCVISNVSNGVIIGADTIVMIDGTILGKPHSTEEAKRMLTLLSGNVHTVVTGITVIDKEISRVDTALCETLVQFRTLTEREIEKYIRLKEPFDKAGGYGVQGPGCIFVSKIEGDYNNVVGLPLFMLAQMLKNFDIYPF